MPAQPRHRCRRHHRRRDVRRRLRPLLGGTITGTVTTGGGATPLGNLNVQIVNAATNAITGDTTDASGNFSVKGLPDGHTTLAQVMCRATSMRSTTTSNVRSTAPIFWRTARDRGCQHRGGRDLRP
ncbi:MAG: carboxypeptidase regulatory-like domain-containing protein [Acidobacteria bacterium]|nr:carboxypeptidase regulatory-like domain-containing protein [Acidobacteriota bacterium]